MQVDMGKWVTRLVAGAALWPMLVAWPAWGQTAGNIVFTPVNEVIEDSILDESVPPPLDVNALNTAQAIEAAAGLNQSIRLQLPQCIPFAFRAEGARVTNNIAMIPGECLILDNGSAPPFVAVASLTTGEFRQFETAIVATIDQRLGQPGRVELRGLGTGLPVLTANAADLATAKGDLLTQARSQTGRRYFAGAEVQTGGGPEQVTDRVISERLIRSQLVLLGFRNFAFGGQGGEYRFGDAHQCPSATTLEGCVGGVRIDAAPFITFGQAVTQAELIRILTITQQVERTITGGTTFFDLPLTALPSGAIHAAAPQGGFGANWRFLRRLTDGPGEGALRRGAIWGEAHARDGSFDASAALGRVEGQGEGLVMGLLLSPAEHLTFGIAGEYGTGALAIADPLTPESADLTHLLVGVHGQAVLGEFDLAAAFTYGSTQVESRGLSDLGTANADYDGDLFGLSGEVGYRIAAGPVVLRPHVGAARLHWDREGFAETGGPAPLSVAEDTLRQTRLWAGLEAEVALGGEDSAVSFTAYGRAVRTTGDRQSVVTAFDPQVPGIGWEVAGPATARTAAELGAALDWRVSEEVVIALGYDGRLADNQRDHAARAAVRAAF